MPKLQLAEYAKVAVEEKLGLRPTIDDHEEQFLRNLIGSHLHARDAMNDSDAAFFADVIPWISSLIQLYGAQVLFKEAVNWVENIFESTKPISILTVLTTIYLVQRGIDKSLESPDKSYQELWEEISRRLGLLVDSEQGLASKILRDVHQGAEISDSSSRFH